jgi:phosphatidylethanolamine/phosphatidyl-N-methylethanolamine N-methyltransferase
MASDSALFLRQLIRNPRQISAISPSSPWLARAMTAGITPHTGPVVEFGPGTGRLTAAILARGVAPHDLTLFEMNADFVHHLRARFPGVHVHHGPAQDAPDVMRKPVGKVISGLPLLAMPVHIRQDIILAAMNVLSQSGVMVQFTYGSKPALEQAKLDAFGIKVKLRRKVLLNLPPAQVMEYRRV